MSGQFSVTRVVCRLRMTYNTGGTKYIDSWCLLRKEFDDDAECKPQICQCEPREDERDDVVLIRCFCLVTAQCEDIKETYECLQVEEEHANGTVAGFVEVEEVDERVH